VIARHVGGVTGGLLRGKWRAFTIVLLKDA